APRPMGRCRDTEPGAGHHRSLAALGRKSRNGRGDGRTFPAGGESARDARSSPALPCPSCESVMTELLDRQSAFSGTRPASGLSDAVRSSLERYLHQHVAGFEGPLTIAQFKGGQSNPTYLLSCGTGHYVLRRKPPGKLLPSAHAIDREYRVTSALSTQGFPVARPL